MTRRTLSGRHASFSGYGAVALCGRPPRPFPSESRNSSPFGLLRFRSPLLTESILFLLLPVLRCFSSRGSLRRGMCSPSGDATYRAGFPHSGTRGSKPEDGSPRPIAAFRALRRQPVPRHPPHALKVACSHAGRGNPLPRTGQARARPLRHCMLVCCCSTSLRMCLCCASTISGSLNPLDLERSNCDGVRAVSKDRSRRTRRLPVPQDPAGQHPGLTGQRRPSASAGPVRSYTAYDILFSIERR